MKISDIELEKLVIGGFMIIPDVSGEVCQKAFSMIKPSMFTIQDHRTIFEYISRIIKSNRPVEFMELSSLLDNDSSYQADFTYAGSIYRNTASHLSLLTHCKMLRESAQRRFALSKISDALMSLQDDNGENTKDIIAGLGSFADQFISKKSDEQGLKHITDIMPKFLDAVDNRFADPEKFSGYSSGIESLDQIMGVKKIRKGSLFVIGARPKMGKTMLKSKLVNHFAINLNTAVLDYSMEMLEDEVVERAIADDTGVNTEIFYDPKSGDDKDWGLVAESTARLNKSNLYINDKTGLTLAEIKAQARTVHRKHNVGLIAIDYLTLMKAEKAERNDLGYAEITKGLKGLAKELQCVVLLLTQLNRNLESRSDKRPMPSDSRDTGQIEQDCDYWLGIYREAVYSKDVPQKMTGYTEIELRLNRHGGTGPAYLNMNGGRFEEITLMDYAKMDHMKSANQQTGELN